MYQLGKRTRKYHRGIIGLVVGLLVVVGCVASYKALHLTAAPRTNIRNTPATSRPYTADTGTKIQIDKPAFIMNLPAGWTEAKQTNTNFSADSYNFQSPSKDARAMSVYIDKIPAALAINRALTVTPKGATLVYGTVSDNCSTFTRPSKTDPGSGVAAGLWQGASFWCDLGNYERNVSGTVSAEGINYATLTGPTTGRHKVFFTYTDNGPSPDYTVFYNALGSFSLK